jgi:type II secretory pathway component PulF
MSDQIPSDVLRAARKFSPKRAEYYGYLAGMLTASKGSVKVLTLFERDAQRYEGEPRGILASYWAATYSNNGSNLALTWQGTLPDDEVSILRVAQDAGGGALETALEDVARIATLADKVKSEVVGTLAAAMMGVVVATTMWTLFPIVVSAKLLELYSFIPFEAWGKAGKSLVGYADNVKSYGLLAVLCLAMVGAWLQWSINNWTGQSRDWADQNVVLWRAVRDIKGAMFLATMSTLTRKRGNVMFTLLESLMILSESVRSRWLRWRIDEIVYRVDQTGAVNSDAFATNLLSREMYFFLRDTQESRGFAEGFAETGRYVEQKLIASIVKRMTVYRWVVLVVSLILAIAMVGFTFSVINEMRSVMQNYYSSR